MNIKSQVIIANIIAITDGVMQATSGGEELADMVKRDGVTSPFCEATAIAVNNKLNNGAANVIK